MKVLKQPPEFHGMRLKCSCGAELMADQLTDFVRRCGSDDGYSWDYLTVDCPCCETELRVEVTRFPQHLLEKIRRAES